MSRTKRRYNLIVSVPEYERLRRMARLVGWDEDTACAELVHEGLGLLTLAGELVARGTVGSADDTVDAVVRALLLPIVSERPGYSGGLSEDEVSTGALLVALEARENELPENVRERGAFARAVAEAVCLLPAGRVCPRPARPPAEIMKLLAAARLVGGLDEGTFGMLRLVPHCDPPRRDAAATN